MPPEAALSRCPVKTQGSLSQVSHLARDWASIPTSQPWGPLTCAFSIMDSSIVLARRGVGSTFPNATSSKRQGYLSSSHDPGLALLTVSGEKGPEESQAQPTPDVRQCQGQISLALICTLTTRPALLHCLDEMQSLLLSIGQQQVRDRDSSPALMTPEANSPNLSDCCKW